VNRIPRVLLRIALLPVGLVRLVSRLLGRLLGTLFAPVTRKFDSSEYLSSLINSLSSAMATRRGLPILVGTALLVVSWITHGIVLAVLVSTANYDRNLYLLCIPFTLVHLGILAGFTGTMLAIPLGQGYKDK
jgi:hypothetical protein